MTDILKHVLQNHSSISGFAKGPIGDMRPGETSSVPYTMRSNDPVRAVPPGTGAAYLATWGEVDQAILAVQHEKARAARSKVRAAVEAHVSPGDVNMKVQVSRAFEQWLLEPLVLECPQHSICHLAVRELDMARASVSSPRPMAPR